MKEVVSSPVMTEFVKFVMSKNPNTQIKSPSDQLRNARGMFILRETGRMAYNKNVSDHRPFMRLFNGEMKAHEEKYKDRPMNLVKLMKGRGAARTFTKIQTYIKKFVEVQ